MAQVTFLGEGLNTEGVIPQVGKNAPEFSLTSSDLSEKGLSDFKGKNLVINIFPSIDTPVCALSVKEFNSRVAACSKTEVLCVSADLPFAVSRFCEIEALVNVSHLSTFRNPNFSKEYGVAIIDGALRGLNARAIVCVNAAGVVVHSELVDEITNEPDYERALNSF
ncbi:thiol peroxidase [Enterovibrio coralii]|uniref:Thioredoxin domain-containing protein n=1 Tax=Enterovibrio coralii TaxID=294935 RepID=A0A135I5Y9_9GAMM|nr:thiol peroxidase [Enterovibrio coralii]KXF80804.1 hypothetical protein ATN88_16125 [Enterovibrio coralii]